MIRSPSTQSELYAPAITATVTEPTKPRIATQDSHEVYWLALSTTNILQCVDTKSFEPFTCSSGMRPHRQPFVIYRRGADEQSMANNMRKPLDV